MPPSPAIRIPIVTDWSADPDDWGDFLCRTFDIWLKNGFGKVVVNWFESLVGQWMRQPAQVCTLAEVLRKVVGSWNETAVSIPAIALYTPSSRSGTSATRGVNSSTSSIRPSQRRFGCHKRDRLTNFCKQCQYRFACNGDCSEEPIREIARRPTGPQLFLFGLKTLSGARRSLPSTDCCKCPASTSGSDKLLIPR